MLSEVLAQLLTTPFAIILVDDGSREPVVSPGGDRIVLIRHPFNLGQGASIQTGFTAALRLGADYVVTYDADGQHRTEDIYRLLAPLLSDEADITLGSRFLEESRHNASLPRRSLLTLARRVNNLLTGLRLTDAHNGLRGLNKKALQQIHLTENRMAHATEIIYQIKKHRLRYTEVPVHIAYTGYSRSKGQGWADGVRVFFDLVLHKLFG